MSNEVQRYITGVLTPVEMANPGPASISARQTVVVTYDDYAALMLQAQGLEAECERFRELAKANSRALGDALRERDALRTQLEAIRAAGGEEPKVVAYMDVEPLMDAFQEDWRAAWNRPGEHRDALMTVAQHQRIVAAMAAELEQLRKDAGAEMFLTLSGELAQTRKELEAARKQEHCAEIIEGWRIVFAGAGPILPIVERHGLKIGSKLYALPPLAGKVAVPDVLFDGHAVYTESCRLRAIKGGNARTSPENVSDTLDAVVSLLRDQQAEVKP